MWQSLGAWNAADNVFFYLYSHHCAVRSNKNAARTKLRQKYKPAKRVFFGDERRVIRPYEVADQRQIVVRLQ
jgi:hypothetical protein